MICDMDCFNCPFPDCINDGKQTSKERKMQKVESKRKRKNTYYWRNREHCIEKAKEYRKNNPEKAKAYQKAYYRENAEEKKLYAKKHHQEMSENPEYVEKMRKKSKLYYAKKREERRATE